MQCNIGETTFVCHILCLHYINHKVTKHCWGPTVYFCAYATSEDNCSSRMMIFVHTRTNEFALCLHLARCKLWSGILFPTRLTQPMWCSLCFLHLLFCGYVERSLVLITYPIPILSFPHQQVRAHCSVNRGHQKTPYYIPVFFPHEDFLPLCCSQLPIISSNAVTFLLRNEIFDGNLVVS